MNVVVTKECARCGKKSNETVTLETAVALDTTNADRKAAYRQLEEGLMDSLAGSAHKPVLMLAVMGEDGNYIVKAMGDLCSGTRSCTSRISALLNEVFVPVRHPAKKGSKAAPAVAGDLTYVEEALPEEQEDEDLNG